MKLTSTLLTTQTAISGPMELKVLKDLPLQCHSGLGCLLLGRFGTTNTIGKQVEVIVHEPDKGNCVRTFHIFLTHAYWPKWQSSILILLTLRWSRLAFLVSQNKPPRQLHVEQYPGPFMYFSYWSRSSHIVQPTKWFDGFFKFITSKEGPWVPGAYKVHVLNFKHVRVEK